MITQLIKKTILISIFLISLQPDKIYSSPISGDDYVKNELNLKIDTDIFEFPLEVCGAYLTYSQDSGLMKIDSFHYLNFWPNTRTIKAEEKISLSDFKNRFPNIYNKITFEPPKSLQKLFKKYEVNYIGRVVKNFALSDTIPKSRIGRTGKKFEIKLPNQNKYLKISFPENFDAMQIKPEFECLSYVTSVNLNQIIKYSNLKGPKLIQKENPNLPDSLKNKVLGKTVIITVTVTENGSIEEAQVFRSANSLLDSISLEASYKCKFEPGINNGKPQRMKFNVPYKF
jgi:TonB family protein